MARSRKFSKKALGITARPHYQCFVTHSKFNIQDDSARHRLFFFPFFSLAVIYLGESVHDHAGVQRSVCQISRYVQRGKETFIFHLFPKEPERRLLVRGLLVPHARGLLGEHVLEGLSGPRHL